MLVAVVCKVERRVASTCGRTSSGFGAQSSASASEGCRRVASSSYELFLLAITCVCLRLLATVQMLFILRDVVGWSVDFTWVPSDATMLPLKGLGTVRADSDAILRTTETLLLVRRDPRDVSLGQSSRPVGVSQSCGDRL